jgi:hypothetical protein
MTSAVPSQTLGAGPPMPKRLREPSFFSLISLLFGAASLYRVEAYLAPRGSPKRGNLP